jgi:hypothetical protein
MSVSHSTINLSPLLNIAVAIVPGLVNLWSSYYRLDKACSKYPFFNSFVQIRIWLFWFLPNFFLPVLMAWYTFNLFNSSCSVESVNALTFLSAFSFGLGFVALVNMETAIGPYSFEAKVIYGFILHVTRSAIESDGRTRNASFYENLSSELEGLPDSTIQRGVRYLEQYYDEMYDDGVKLETTTNNIKLLTEANQAQNNNDKARELTDLMKTSVSRRDWKAILSAFSCSQTLNSYETNMKKSTTLKW